jgi:hypothetical protein
MQSRLTTAQRSTPVSLAIAPADARNEIPWRERPLQSMQVASDIACVSKASLYRFAKEGRLTLKRLAGRTLVETTGLIELLENADEWTPSTRPEKARATRAERARAAWRSR